MEVKYGAGVPVFGVVDLDRYCRSVAAVREAITPRTRAIPPVQLAMRFTGTNARLDVAQEHHRKTIEDCAHAHGRQYKGRGAGSVGGIGCFSFRKSKLMTAGEGGRVFASNFAYYEHPQSPINCGRASITDQNKQRVPGVNCGITDATLSEALEGIESARLLPAQPAITRDMIYGYVFQYRSEAKGVSRDLFAAAQDAEGIPCDGRFYEAVYRSGL